MEHRIVPIGSEGGKLETFFLIHSPEIAGSRKRPLVVICPGGGYAETSDREAEPIAMAFAAKGYHTMIVWYPVAPHRYPAALCCLAQSVAWARAHAEEFSIDAEKIAVLGFSAGGHLAGNLGISWNTDFLRETAGCSSGAMRPNRLVLCYPVITAGEKGHRGSFVNLLGEDSTQEQREQLSLEKLVTEDTPPTFLWSTQTDNGVPMENAMLFSMALRKYNIPQELHIYSEGRHGLALCNETTNSPTYDCICPACEGWFQLCCDWLARPAISCEPQEME